PYPLTETIALISCSRFSLSLLLFFLILRPPPRSTLFPYTTLFRSSIASLPGGPIFPRRRLRESVACSYPFVFLFILHAPDSRNRDRKSTRLNSSHVSISYAVFCLKKKKLFTNRERCHHIKEFFSNC